MPLHPQSQQFLDALAEQRAAPWEAMSPEEGRQVFSSLKDLFGAGPDLHQVQDRVTTEGVVVRIYRAAAGDAQPVAMYFHGGGWVLGDLDTHDTLCRLLASESQCVVVAVDYRLAPEHPFPAALEDCCAATRFVVERAAELGVDVRKLVVAGDSSGGNLATALAIKFRDEGGPSIHSQLLVYPVLEPKFNEGSYREFADGYGLTRASMMWFWEKYLGSNAPSRYAVPLRVESLEGLPPAHLITAEFDVLRDESARYAQRLTAAGVPTTVRQYDGMLHGFFHFCGAFDVGRQAVTDAARVLGSVRDADSNST